MSYGQGGYGGDRYGDKQDRRPAGGYNRGGRSERVPTQADVNVEEVKKYIDKYQKPHFTAPEVQSPGIHIRRLARLAAVPGQPEALVECIQEDNSQIDHLVMGVLVECIREDSSPVDHLVTGLIVVKVELGQIMTRTGRHVKGIGVEVLLEIQEHSREGFIQEGSIQKGCIQVENSREGRLVMGHVKKEPAPTHTGRRVKGSGVLLEILLKKVEVDRAEGLGVVANTDETTDSNCSRNCDTDTKNGLGYCQIATAKGRGWPPQDSPCDLGISVCYSTNVRITQSLKAPPEPLKEVAAELWTREQLNLPPPAPKPEVEPNAVLDHPLYTPPAKPQLGVGPIVAPLRWPEYDQSMKSAQETGFPSPPHWWHAEFENVKEAPIGDYPRNVPMQWTQLKDPFKYWDKQGRRNFGEILHDQDNFHDWLSIGPEVSWRVPFSATLQVFGAIAFMGFCISWWDPEKHRWFAEKDYPFDGLRVELGGDPNNPEDNFMAARSYKL
ncbi:hypothetical protein HK102_003596 [Quaeritorhiza haematococci]|nr:hypothetical protein HK102_003596 [Quaeritorhiza haematococci]